MTVLRNVMLIIGAAIYAYTLVVVFAEGVNFFPAFFNDLLAVTWKGQINLDFACYLMLSGLWLAWRSGFSSSGIMRGLLAAVLGMMFFVPQMLILIARSKGDLRTLLLGDHAAG